MNNREAIVKANLGLVHACAKKFINRGVDYDDLYQAGCVGLLKAVDGFDESLGFVFSTYAVPAILGEIKRIFRDGGTVKVSRSLKEKSREAWKIKEDLSLKFGREPTVSEISEKMGLNVCEVSEMLLATQPVLSLTPQDNENNKEFDVPSGFTQDKLDERICLEECLKNLSLSDRKIIDLRYFKAKTQSDVAKELGMSQVQVSRREKKILRGIREKMTV